MSSRFDPNSFIRGYVPAVDERFKRQPPPDDFLDDDNLLDDRRRVVSNGMHEHLPTAGLITIESRAADAERGWPRLGRAPRRFSASTSAGARRHAHPFGTIVTPYAAGGLDPFSPPALPDILAEHADKAAHVADAFRTMWEIAVYAFMLVDFVHSWGGNDDFAACLWSDGLDEGDGDDNFAPKWWFGGYRASRVAYIRDVIGIAIDRMQNGYKTLVVYDQYDVIPFNCAACGLTTKASAINLEPDPICICPAFFDQAGLSAGRKLFHEYLHYIKVNRVRDTHCCKASCQKWYGPDEAHHLATNCTKDARNTPDNYAYFAYNLARQVRGGMIWPTECAPEWGGGGGGGGPIECQSQLATIGPSNQQCFVWDVDYDS